MIIKKANQTYWRLSIPVIIYALGLSSQHPSQHQMRKFSVTVGPVFIAAQCATPCAKCLYVCVVCGYCRNDSACVSVRALCCIFILPSPGCKFL